MPLIEYVGQRFHGQSQRLIDRVNEVITTYRAQGYVLTLRQLYYRLVSANVIANTVREYKNLGNLVVKGRRAGLIDWDAIEDRTRNLKGLSSWLSPAAAVKSLADQYHVDMWASQHVRPEVWIEKEALAGVFERVCNELDVPFFCCRGYNSESEMWRASMRAASHYVNGQEYRIFHFGDHDPSGLDMTNDLQKRMDMFGANVLVDRIALSMDQVKKNKLPPNPARETDARFKAYRKLHGDQSWELDAIEPRILSDLVRRTILRVRDEDTWNMALRQERREQRQLERVAAKWPKAVKAAK